MPDWLSLLAFIAAVILVASSGAVFKPGAWYRSLDKPRWTPPSWLFAPAWSVLYLLIAIAGWRVWQSGMHTALAVWAVNLAANAMWSWLMFGRRQITAALADAGAMLVTIILFMVVAWPADKTAALLFAPYLAWVAFATALNASLLQRNPRAT